MAKCWQPNQDAKFARELKFNTDYYVIREQATRLAPYEDKALYDVYRFTQRAPITGTPMTEGGTTAKQLCRNLGPVYDAPPRGMRRLGDRNNQVEAPLGSNYHADLTPAEIRDLERRVEKGSDPRTRRRLGSWRV